VGCKANKQLEVELVKVRASLSKLHCIMMPLRRQCACSLSLPWVCCDSDADVFAAGSGLGGWVAWYENGGSNPVSWTNSTVSVGITSSVMTQAVTAGDLSGRGRPDLVVGSYNRGLFWFENLGGTPLAWANRTVTTTLLYISSVVVIDVDQNGLNDLVCGSFNDYSQGVVWFENLGGSPVAWAPARVITNAAYGVYSLAAANLDNRGGVDIVSARWVAGALRWPC
jgi:hypothetical protein